MKKTIIVVDDEANLRELVKQVLVQEDFRVLEAKNGEECLKFLEYEHPDLIIIDMMMPSMSGLELSENIRMGEKTKDLQLMFLSVVALSEAGQEKLKKLKVEEYMTKPFENDQLVRTVKRLVQGGA